MKGVVGRGRGPGGGEEAGRRQVPGRVEVGRRWRGSSGNEAGVCHDVSLTAGGGLDGARIAVILRRPWRQTGHRVISMPVRRIIMVWVDSGAGASGAVSWWASFLLRVRLASRPK